MLLNLVFAAALGGGSIPPYPPEFRRAMTEIPKTQLQALRNGSIRFCQTNKRYALRKCVVLQDAAVFDIDGKLRMLREAPRPKQKLASDGRSYCREMYEDNSSADVRILQACLSNIVYMVLSSSPAP